MGVDKPETYTMKFESEPYDTQGYTKWDRETRLLKPSQGYSLVVIKVRVANGVKERRTLWTALSDERIHNSITDSEGAAHVAVAYDFQGAPTQTAWLLPGEQTTFNVIFSVPTGTQIRDLVFTLKNNQGDAKGNDVRVTLKEANR